MDELPRLETNWWSASRGPVRFAIASCLVLASLLGVSAVPAYPSPVGAAQSDQNGAAAVRQSVQDNGSLWHRTTTDPVALFTFWLAVLTGGLVVANIKLWRTTQDTLTHLEREFIASHRPRIVVRQIGVEESDRDDVDFITFVAANVGDTTATVTRHNAGAFAHDSAYAPASDLEPVVRAQGHEETVLLAAGESATLRAPIETMLAHAIRSNELRGRQVHCVGFVDYRDQSGISRRTGFLYIYNATGGRFMPIADSDYQYAD